jgi:tRNA-dihydrouridine synthase B
MTKNIFNNLINASPSQPLMFLAPMAGYTNSSFRRCCTDFSASLTYTEMVSARGITNASEHTLQLLETRWDETAPFAHIYGKDPDIMAQAADILSKMNKFSGIDINCGCPARKVASKGYGSKLMHNPQLIYDIVKAIKQSTTLPVTVKTRIGISEGNMNYIEILDAVQQAGGDAIAFHARTITNGHKGMPLLEQLAEAKAISKIPVIGNGGIKSKSDAEYMIQQTGVDAVMVGQAALGNPWIFEKDALETISLDKKKEMLLKNIEMDIKLIDNFYKETFPRKWAATAEEGAIVHFRSHIFMYLKGTPGWHPFKNEVSKIKTVKQLTTILNQF